MSAKVNTGNWIEAFEQLREYVATHPEINVNEQMLTIPQDLRSEFYDLVTNVQLLLTTKILGYKAEDVYEIAEQCTRVRDELILMSGLKEFKLASALENLILAPETTLAKPAFGIILDGLQQGLAPEEMKNLATDSLVPFSRELLRNAYEAWAYYGIVAALKPTKFYAVYSPDTVEVYAVDADSITVGAQITSPERRMPEAVFQTEDGRIYAMKSEVASELDFYGAKITRRRDNSNGGKTIDYIAHRVLLLYELEGIDKVSLIADRDRMFLLPSDLMCEFLLPDEMEQPLCISLFFDRITTVRSKRPVQVLTYDEKGNFPVSILEDSTLAPVDRRVIGLDNWKLQEIADLLAK